MLPESEEAVLDEVEEELDDEESSEEEAEESDEELDSSDEELDVLEASEDVDPCDELHATSPIAHKAKRAAKASEIRILHLDTG